MTTIGTRGSRRSGSTCSAPCDVPRRAARDARARLRQDHQPVRRRRDRRRGRTSAPTRRPRPRWCGSRRRSRASCDGIDVNAIAPGALPTRMLDEVIAAGYERIEPIGLRARDGARRLPGVGGERRHQRPPDRRAVGRLGVARRARDAARSICTRCGGSSVSDYTRAVPRRGGRAGARAAGGDDRGDRRRAGRACASAAGGCSSSASAAAPGTPRTRSTTSARSATSRATRRPTTSPSSPRGSTTTAGRRRTRRGCAARGIGADDAVLVFSVGGGSREHGVSTNLVAALDLAREVGARIYGIVGKPDGETARVADACVVVPAPPERLHAARRGVPGRRLAPARLAPAAERAGRQVGIAR